MSWALCEALLAVQIWPRDDDDSHSTDNSLSKGEQDPHAIHTDPDSPYSDTEECVPLPSDFLLSLHVMTNDAHETLDDSIPRAPNQPTGPGPSEPEGSKILSPTETPGEPPPPDKLWFSGSNQCHSVEYTLPHTREKAPIAAVGSDPPASLSGNVLKEWFRGTPQDSTRPQPTATEHPHNCRCWRC